MDKFQILRYVIFCCPLLIRWGTDYSRNLSTGRIKSEASTEIFIHSFLLMHFIVSKEDICSGLQQDKHYNNHHYKPFRVIQSINRASYKWILKPFKFSNLLSESNSSYCTKFLWLAVMHTVLIRAVGFLDYNFRGCLHHF